MKNIEMIDLLDDLMHYADMAAAYATLLIMLCCGVMLIVTLSPIWALLSIAAICLGIVIIKALQREIDEYYYK